MRDLVYYIATTLDGFIAREDGSFADFPWDDEFGADLLSAFPEHSRRISGKATWTAQTISVSTRS